ncbi:MAG: hypothetical protein H6564_20860 [Lewinellaceae bacterium]|nr:hypothetical protein [Lewinellaceae bacterium]
MNFYKIESCSIVFAGIAFYVGTGVLEIRALLIQYYTAKVEEEVEQIWEKRKYSSKSFDEATKGLHLRAKKQACR